MWERVSGCTREIEGGVGETWWPKDGKVSKSLVWQCRYHQTPTGVGRCLYRPLSFGFISIMTSTLFCVCETKAGPNLHHVEDPDLRADRASWTQQPNSRYMRIASSTENASCAVTNVCVSLYASALIVVIQFTGTYCWSPAPRSAHQYRPGNDAHKYSRDRRTLVLRLQSGKI